MAEKSNAVAAALDGMASDMAAELRRHFDGLKNGPVVSEAAAVDRMAKAIAALGRANLIVRAVAAAEDKHEEDQRARRTSKMEQLEMDEISPDELEQRADELRARFDRIMANLETKRASLIAPVAGSDAGPPGRLGGERTRRAA